MPKTILITGSSRGIGKAIAEEAYKRGYQVVIHGRTDSPALQEIHKQLTGSIKTIFDISSQSEVSTEINKLLEQVGTVDALVNNAGVRLNPMKTLDELNPEAATGEWQINVLGTLYCIQAVLPAMIEQKKGSIINIASIKGHFQLATTSSLTYSATKSGVISITQSLAKTYAESGIRFNSISPGYIETDQVNDWSEDTLRRIKEGTLLGRIGKPEEIASLVMYVASEEASYITGTDILADGGYMLKGK